MNQQENILSYLRGELSESEKLEFEQQLKADPALAAEFERQQQSWQLMGELSARQEQKAEIGSWIAEASTGEAMGKVRRFSPRTRYAAIAAAVVLLAVLGYLLFPQTATTQELYADYYQDYTPSQMMGEGDIADSLYQQGVKAYKENKFEEAVSALQKITGETPIYFDAQMLIGAAYMQQEKYAEAIPFFEQVSQSPALADVGTWYQAWAHLMADQKVEAKTLFQKIATSQGYKHREAEKLLTNL